MNRQQRRAVARQDRVAGSVPDATVMFGAALREHRAGRLTEAERTCRRVLSAAPLHAGGLHLLGVIYQETGRLHLAVEAMSKAVDLMPGRPAYHLNLGTAWWKQGNLTEAAAAYGRAIGLDPEYAQAHFNLGTVLWRQHQTDAAERHLRRAIELNPRWAEPRGNLGAMLLEQGRLSDAIACLTAALQIRPSYPEAINNLGSALLRKGHVAEAVDCYRAAIEMDPGHAEAHFNLGTALLEQAQTEAATACFRAALAIRPEYVAAWDNLGTALKQQGQLDEAVSCYRRSVALDPDYAPARSNLALALLSRGALEEGWREYEWRWHTEQLREARRQFSEPQWRGEPAEGRTLLIHGEQGFGDTLQFCRYAPLAAERGMRVVLEVQQPLVRLLRSLPGVDKVIAQGEALPDFDVHCPIMSLPLAFGTTLSTIPAKVPYLSASPAEVEAWHRRLAAITPIGRRVGLVWAGNPRRHLAALAAVDRRRSLPPELLSPLFLVPGWRLFSLQKDGPAAPADLPLVNYMDEMADFAATTALIANLDLVISVDTSVAHLAAALGKPVWLLDRFDACWRWLTGRRDSPWYPTLRLYRQPSPGDWAAVLRDVVDDLRRMGGSSVERDVKGAFR